ncbi:MAG: hypothetical protein Q9197_001241, partial [Variospora fuerteventurae]
MIDIRNGSCGVVVVVVVASRSQQSLDASPHPRQRTTNGRYSPNARFHHREPVPARAGALQDGERAMCRHAGDLLRSGSGTCGSETL